jgi:hypothetical protein
MPVLGEPIDEQGIGGSGQRRCGPFADPATTPEAKSTREKMKSKPILTWQRATAPAHPGIQWIGKIWIKPGR